MQHPVKLTVCKEAIKKFGPVPRQSIAEEFYSRVFCEADDYTNSEYAE